MVIKPGIYPGMGMEDYHNWVLDKEALIDGPVSCSMIKSFDVNPYAWKTLPPFKPTDAMRLGSLFDLALTDPGKLEDGTAIMKFPNFRTKEAREWRDSFAGRLVVTEEEMAHARDAATQVWSHKVAGRIMDKAATQVGVVGDIGGIPAKALLDILPAAHLEFGDFIYDYKTTSNGLHDEAIRKTMGQFRYHWQAAFYKTLHNKAPDEIRGPKRQRFGFIFQDVRTLEVRVVNLHPDSLATGATSVGLAVSAFTKAAYSGIQSRYADSTDDLALLPYHAMSEEDRHAAEIDLSETTK